MDYSFTPFSRHGLVAPITTTGQHPIPLGCGSACEADIERAVWELLKATPDGMTVDELCSAVRERGLKISGQKLRELIRHLCVDHMHPVCTHPARGVWIARTREDLELTKAQIMSRAKELYARARAIDELIEVYANGESAPIEKRMSGGRPAIAQGQAKRQAKQERVREIKRTRRQAPQAHVGERDLTWDEIMAEPFPMAA